MFGRVQVGRDDSSQNPPRGAPRPGALGHRQVEAKGGGDDGKNAGGAGRGNAGRGGVQAMPAGGRGNVPNPLNMQGNLPPAGRGQAPNPLLQQQLNPPVPGPGSPFPGRGGLNDVDNRVPAGGRRAPLPGRVNAGAPPGYKAPPFPQN
ncbi:MAG: hypothetical protein JSS32_09470 [Verrucomicrobia bacterium]|nr:hypothetical protein [Verrucomicrobiota bacterium]